MKKNLQKQKTIVRFYFLFVMLLATSSLLAQPYNYNNHHTYGSTHDLEVVNTDFSNNGAGIRLQAAGNSQLRAYSLFNDFEKLHFKFSTSNQHNDGGIDLMTLTEFAQLGIGTSNPQAKLHVIGNSGLPGSFGSIVIGSTNATNLRIGYNTDINDTWIQSHDQATLSINTDGNHTLINEKAGSVGIGTRFPYGKINIVGNSGDFTSLGTLIIGDASTTNLRFGYDLQNNDTWIQAHAGATLTINGWGNTTLFNTNGGRVGIGTTSPQATLHVNGDFRSGNLQAQDITANKVNLNIGSFPDYVFKEGYNRMSLEEVAKFINQNGRLPKMPSEKEVMQSGMDVGKINVLLVEKIEELTLHLIEMEQKFKQIESRLNKL